MKKNYIVLCVALASLLCVRADANPFDDLNAEEIASAVKIVRDSAKYSAEARFPVVKRQEPKKSDWISGKAVDQRQAYVAVFDFKSSMMTELVVDLKAKRIVSAKNLPGIKPPLLLEEYERARKIARADERWRKALNRRGFKDLDKEVFLDMWGPGLIRREENTPGQRLLRGVSYKRGEGKNVYSRPIEGVIITVDLSTMKVASFWDIESAPVAPGTKELTADQQGRLDPALKPIETKMPDGPSYRIDGQEVTWARWKFRYSMDPLQGLQLFHVRFNDGEKDRSIIYKLSLAEMLVPYGNGAKTWSFRSAFDVGEYGLGKTLHPLVAGQDVPSYATLLDTALADDLGGEAQVIKGMALYERDSGVIWKHRNSENGDSDLRHGRQLVLTFMTTIGNYDYGIDYVFNLDGTIDVDVKLTGMLLAKGTELERNPCEAGCEPLVEKNVLAPPHQHMFNFRIDFDIDGPGGNYAAETNVRAVPKGKNNPDGNAFEQVNTVFKREKDAIRDIDFKSARKWKVFSRASRNATDHPRGYALIPGEVAYTYLQPDNQMRQRARFIEHQAWFTVYKDDEMSGAHPYPTTAPAGAGLPKYVADNESLEGADIVLWYTFGVTHYPHPEEWPIMNVHHTGFTLAPVNFFSENPAMKLRD